jgi:hypothetical protein
VDTNIPAYAIGLGERVRVIRHHGGQLPPTVVGLILLVGSSSPVLWAAFGPDQVPQPPGKSDFR